MATVCAAVLTPAVLFAVHVQTVATADPPATRPAATGSATAGPAAAGRACHHVRGPFGVAGTHMVTGGGQRFIPYGVNLTLLRKLNGGYRSSVTLLKAEEGAAATAWCANLVRIFALQEELIVDGKLNRPYLAALETSIGHAQAKGLAVVLTVDQQDHYAPRLPVATTLHAWRVLTARYGHDPQVIFDIFNEPSGKWQLWQYGGQYGGRRYYGMQHLARLIRAHGGRNLLWVQGHHRGGTLTGIPRYHLRRAGPLVYDEHRPPAPHTAASWTASFGFVAIRDGYPVVEGEWADYSRTAAGWACWDDAPATVPRFLAYLTQHGMGLVAFDLSHPWLLASASLTDPNHYGSDWACQDGLNEGAGREIMTWLNRSNGGA